VHRIKKHKLAKELIVLASMAIVFIVVLKTVPDAEELKADMIAAGPLGPLILIGAHITQNLVFLIPGPMITIAGGYIYGNLWGFVYNIVGTLIGTWMLFWITRMLGQKYVEKVISHSEASHFQKFLIKHENMAIFYSRLLPIFPSDFITMLSASATNISTKDFILYTMLGSIPRVMVENMFGNEISMGRGGPVVIFIVAVLIIVLLIHLFRERIRQFMIVEEKSISHLYDALKSRLGHR